jgi:hypothetical protein
MPQLTDRRGSTLIVVMLLVSLMLIAITGAFVRTSAERRSALDGAAQVDAFTLAQEGIDKYIALVTSIPASMPDSQPFTLTGGRAVVVLRYFHTAASDTTLVLISRGEVNSADKYSSDAAIASRTVTQLVKWTGGSMTLPAGFTALSGFTVNGNSATISGVDACTTAPAPLTSIPGVAVPQNSVADTSAMFSSNHPSDVVSSAPITQPIVDIGTPGSTGTAKDSVNVDWAGITARTAITPNYFQKTTAPTSGSFPTSAQINGSHWPVTFVQGDLTLPTAGQGILIITGNLTISGNSAGSNTEGNTWDGIVLVGGTLTGNGTQTIDGAIMTGLNVITGGTPGGESVGNGTKVYQYNSCSITKALKPFGSWTRLANAKTDNYPFY